MARPKGYRLNPPALRDLLQAKQLSMTECAEQCGLGLTMVSALMNGDSRASIRTVRALSAGLACKAETLFPELGNFVEREPVMAS